MIPNNALFKNNVFAIAIFIISKKFSFIQTTFLSCFVGFVLMWIVVWNMRVLPTGLMLLAVPLSLLETFLAGLIIQRLTRKVEEHAFLVGCKIPSF